MEGSHRGLCPPDSDVAWVEVSRAESLAGAKISPVLPPSPRRLPSSEGGDETSVTEQLWTDLCWAQISSLSGTKRRESIKEICSNGSTQAADFSWSL